MDVRRRTLRPLGRNGVPDSHLATSQSGILLGLGKIGQLCRRGHGHLSGVHGGLEFGGTLGNYFGGLVDALARDVHRSTGLVTGVTNIQVR